MQKARIADVKPIKTSLQESETYRYCTCGRSANQPFCDGKHKGTEFKPLSFTAKATTQKWLCMCKQTRTPPYCDGSHQRLSDEDVGREV